MWLFALPALLINVCIILIPAVLTLMMAFFAWDGVGIPVWAGLANFQQHVRRSCLLVGADK